VSAPEVTGAQMVDEGHPRIVFSHSATRATKRHIGAGWLTPLTTQCPAQPWNARATTRPDDSGHQSRLRVTSATRILTWWMLPGTSSSGSCLVRLRQGGDHLVLAHAAVLHPGYRAEPTH
jgi:hypothetical protein